MSQPIITEFLWAGFTRFVFNSEIYGAQCSDFSYLRASYCQTNVFVGLVEIGPVSRFTYLLIKLKRLTNVFLIPGESWSYFLVSSYCPPSQWFRRSLISHGLTKGTSPHKELVESQMMSHDSKASVKRGWNWTKKVNKTQEQRVRNCKTGIETRNLHLRISFTFRFAVLFYERIYSRCAEF